MSSQQNNELWTRGAGELAAMIARRDVTSSEVIEAHLSRIADVNPALNAITRVLADEARAGAAQADAALAAGATLGALHGVPFTVKQNIDLVGSFNASRAAFEQLRKTRGCLLFISARFL